VFCLINKNYFRMDDKYVVFKIANAISETMELDGAKHRINLEQCPVVIMCIGTDRSTGDSLGPLVGDMLSKRNLRNIHVFGTLENPVHARNLEETVTKANRIFPGAYIVAVDASLGSLNHVGSISVGRGPIKPGAGLKKDLPAVGNMHITGVVNTGGFMDFLVLQSTRLSVVMKMADVITKSLHMFFSGYSIFSFRDHLPMSQLNL
jgi:putative sporulation protein YyaC